ncbi:type VI secretion system baseplate subunit TssE [uncultured Methylobacterium sp.]|jgi:type VI secretion system protein ImpF|uniref:type VI secretion system baseplate subunit TssE n=1 Tax=uncultured Methylobacterium sp. TaxID=157278 RepID=UPI0026352D5B|nr:type VI secretion system baseplate subunit TssE [uncultured Methylobacterium sp.]
MVPAGRAIRLSILDRLLDPEESALTALRNGLRRDLEDLLNTNPRVKGWPAHLGELDHSLLSYGIMDLATANLATEQRRSAVVAAIGAIVREWEPRLANLSAVALPNADPTDRSLRIRIEAEILIEPAPEPMVFDTVIDPLTNTVSLASGR